MTPGWSPERASRVTREEWGGGSKDQVRHAGRRVATPSSSSSSLGSQGEGGRFHGRKAAGAQGGEQQCGAAGSRRWDEWIRCKRWTSACADLSVARPLGAKKQSPDKIAPDSRGPHDSHETSDQGAATRFDGIVRVHF